MRVMACCALSLAIGGCETLERMACHQGAMEEGEYLGKRNTGTNCYRDRRGGRYCSETTESVYLWTRDSDRYYNACMADVAARYGRSAQATSKRLP
jgi:hypothetical protein